MHQYRTVLKDIQEVSSYVLRPQDTIAFSNPFGAGEGGGGGVEAPADSSGDGAHIVYPAVIPSSCHSNHQQQHQHQLYIFYALICSVFFLLQLVDLGIGFLSGTRVERIEEQSRRETSSTSNSIHTHASSESALFRPQ